MNTLSNVIDAFQRTRANDPSATISDYVGNILDAMNSSERMEAANAVLATLGSKGDLSLDQVERIREVIGG